MDAELKDPPARVETELGVSSELSLMILGDVDLMSAAVTFDKDPILCDTAPIKIPELGVPAVDWDNLQIVERQDDEGKIEMLTEEQLYALLGLKDEDERSKKAQEDNAKRGKRCIGKQRDDTEGAAILVSDFIPDEVVISYDKDNPRDLGSMYPTMNEFRMALRQFAINEEFDLGTEKSDKKMFRGYCKSSKECPWRIVGSRQDDNTTIKVTVLVDKHDCVSSSRMRTITPSKNWVASKAVSN